MKYYKSRYVNGIEEDSRLYRSETDSTGIVSLYWFDRGWGWVKAFKSNSFTPETNLSLFKKSVRKKPTTSYFWNIYN